MSNKMEHSFVYCKNLSLYTISAKYLKFYKVLDIKFVIIKLVGYSLCSYFKISLKANILYIGISRLLQYTD